MKINELILSYKLKINKMYDDLDDYDLSENDYLDNELSIRIYEEFIEKLEELKEELLGE